jgi:replicative DNA helicase
LKNQNNLIKIEENGIAPEMFLIEANRYIFMTMNYLFHKRQELTPYAIMETVSNSVMKSKVEEYGGIEYLEALSNGRVSEDNIDIFCQKLKQAYTRYSLLNICRDSEQAVLSDSYEVLNPSEILSKHDIMLQELEDKLQQTTEIYKMGDSAEEILSRRAENPSAIPGLEVGFPKFDYFTNGGQPGDLIMVCARAKTGKSTILTNWATKLAIKDQIPIIYFDTEMDERQQEDRILSILSQIPHKEIVSGMFAVDTEYGTAVEKRERLKTAIEELKNGKYFHYYLPNFTVEKVEAVAKKFKAQENIQAIFFDYLKFPSSQVPNLKNAQEWQMLGYIASSLKDLAGTLRLPIYSACQENRSNLDGKKDERNVGGSDRILQLASKLIFLSNKSEEQIIKEGGKNGNQSLYIAYQRNGESNCPLISVNFDRDCITQSEV